MAEQKQKQKFDEQWQRLTTLTGEANPEKGPKIAQNEVAAMFQEVATERIAKAKETFKTKLLGIFEAKVGLDKALQKGRDELAKKEEQEYEKLNQEMNAAFGMMEQVKKQNLNMVNAAQTGNLNSTETSEEGTEGASTSTVDENNTK